MTADFPEYRPQVLREFDSWAIRNSDSLPLRDQYAWDELRKTVCVPGAALQKISKHAYYTNFHRNSSPVSIKALYCVYGEHVWKLSTFTDLLDAQFPEWKDLSGPPNPIAAPQRGTVTFESLNHEGVELKPLGTPKGTQKGGRRLRAPEYANQDSIPTEVLLAFERCDKTVSRERLIVRQFLDEGDVANAQTHIARAKQLWKNFVEEEGVVIPKAHTPSPLGKSTSTMSAAVLSSPEPSEPSSDDEPQASTLDKPVPVRKRGAQPDERRTKATEYCQGLFPKPSTPGEPLARKSPTVPPKPAKLSLNPEPMDVDHPSPSEPMVLDSPQGQTDRQGQTDTR
ncbi:hypothetical protein B0I35DRAFT_481688 [Stachybotrys elegans]|uniref:Uncharacterized protein n=1 Tax=Stachybotrys elegans TaxID=80388 RepID=A0A8K0SK77_9HYPO|nr:hypothetical protein B0I35DRAFT_481688 [Stachybotrys elegans]